MMIFRFNTVKTGVTMKTGFFVSKFLPPHIGHLWAIDQASKQCDVLYVLVAEHQDTCKKLCRQANLPYFNLAAKTKWVKEALKDYPNVKVISLREDGMKPMPEGWAEWSKAVQKLVGKRIDYIFGSEPAYAEYYEKYFTGSKYIQQDPDRTHFNISSTKIRANLKDGLGYIMYSARPFFEKVLQKQKAPAKK